VASLRRGLGAAVELRAPRMPAPESPEYGGWRDAATAEIARLREGAVLLGHSLGGTVLLKVLSEEEHELRAAALFLIATPFWGLPGWEHAPFVLRPDFAARLSQAGSIHIYHSRDDEVVGGEHAERLAAEIPRATLRLVDGHGHAFDRGDCAQLLRDVRAALGS
jgi:uncharacterized protein